MERLIRGLITVQDSPSDEDAFNNWRKFKEYGPDFLLEEDREICKYLADYFHELSAPPAMELVKEYFEKSDKVEVVTRLDEIKKAQPYTRTNYESILRAEIESQQKRETQLILRDAAAIIEHGRSFEKPINGKKHLSGIEDALSYISHKSAKIRVQSGGWNLHGTSWLAEPRKRQRFLLKDFKFGLGRPNLITGYSNVSKTFLAIELAIACAAELPTCWGGVELGMHGPVVYLDYEMGEDPIKSRFQRMIEGFGLDANNIRRRKAPNGLGEVLEDGFQKVALTKVREAERTGAPVNAELAKFAEKGGFENEELLRIGSYPHYKLSTPGAEKAFIDLCKGKTLLIIDSFSAATAGSGMDENSSGISEYLHMLSRVSDKTKCVIVIIHHEKKSKEDDDFEKSDPVQRMQRIRGSSAIAAAAGATAQLYPGKDKSFIIGQGKNSFGQITGSLRLRLQDSGDRDGEVSSAISVIRVGNPETQTEDDSYRTAVIQAVTAGGIKTTRDLYAACSKLGRGYKVKIDEAKAQLCLVKDPKTGCYAIPEVVDAVDMIV